MILYSDETSRPKITKVYVRRGKRNDAPDHAQETCERCVSLLYGEGVSPEKGFVRQAGIIWGLREARHS